MDLASNITNSGVVIVDPYVDNFWLNVLATLSYLMSTSFSMFLIWFASIEFTGNFSEFRPVTQQLVSFCVFHVSYYKYGGGDCDALTSIQLFLFI